MERYASLSMLLVEPSRAQFHILQMRLQAVGITDVKHAKTGSDALATIGDWSPDLVLSAMYLSDMTGAALAQALRARPDTEAQLFALLSSERAPRFLEPIRQAGVIAILEKPLQREPLGRLLAAVQEIQHAEEIEFHGYLDEVRVLLVDDSRTARRFMRQILESLGLERFVEVPDGADAMQLLEEETFDLIVTDLNMPKVDGMTLTRHVRTHSLRPDVPVIMVTSDQDPKRRSQALEAGVSALCDKPFAPALVRELLEDLLEEA